MMNIFNRLLNYVDLDNKALSLVEARLNALVFSLSSLITGSIVYFIFNIQFDRIIKLSIFGFFAIISVFLYILVLKKRDNNFIVCLLFSIFKGATIMSFSHMLKLYLDIINMSYDVVTSFFISAAFSVLIVPFFTSVYYLSFGKTIRDFKTSFLFVLLFSIIILAVITAIRFSSVLSSKTILNTIISVLFALINSFYSVVYFEFARKEYQECGDYSLTNNMALGMVQSDIYSPIEIIYALFHTRK